VARIAVEPAPLRRTGPAILSGTCALTTVVLLASTVLGRLSVGSAVAALGPPVVVLTGVIVARRGKRSSTGGNSIVTVRRFQVQTGSGDLVPCVVYGDFARGELRLGDLVRIPGRWSLRGNPRVVRHITLLYTLTGPEIGRLDARLPARVVVARLASRLCVAVAVFLVLWSGFFLVRR
jgi:hypothetical protein